MLQRIGAGVPDARASEYRWTLAIQWLLTVALVSHWMTLKRPLAWLGIAWPPTAVAAAWTVVLAIAIFVFFARQVRMVARLPAARAQLLEQLAAMPAALALIPRTPAEARLFAALAATAGICEEVLYRGFLLWYVEGFLDRAIAVPVAIVAFGVAHAYQGLRGVALTGIVGGVSMALYLLTGSLIASIVLHATIDLANGHMARVALSTAPPPSSSSQ
jgi:membrane protease YdiL (CAAX protease family)